MRKRKLLAAAGCIAVLACAPQTAFADITIAPTTAAETTAETAAETGAAVPETAAAETTAESERGLAVTNTRAAFDSVAITHVTNYVNVRTEPKVGSTIVGKIYNNCAATILAEVDGDDGKWYQIKSGTVSGYIKAEYFYTGTEAANIAKEVGTVYVTVNASHLRLRAAASTDSEILTTLSQNDEYVEIGEEGDFVKIQVDAALSGYVHKDYITERVEFKEAVSLTEEQEQKAAAEKAKKEAEDAIARVEQLRSEAGSTSAGTSAGTTGSTEATESTSGASEPGAETGETSGTGSESSTGTTDSAGTGSASETLSTGEQSGPSSTGTASGTASTGTVQAGENFGPGYSGSTGTAQTDTAAESSSGSSSGDSALTAATRTAIVAYAKQFLGNPYVYGGTSLTNGADCSGFTMRIFEHFGISTGRSSRDQAANGKQIAVSAVQPGDLVFYSSGSTINHVALYIGNGQIIHASNSRTGIIISTMNYRTPCKAVTFLD